MCCVKGEQVHLQARLALRNLIPFVVDERQSGTTVSAKSAAAEAYLRERNAVTPRARSPARDLSCQSFLADRHGYAWMTTDVGESIRETEGNEAANARAVEIARCVRAMAAFSLSFAARTASVIRWIMSELALLA